jgi:hypothetical protein
MCAIHDAWIAPADAKMRTQTEPHRYCNEFAVGRQDGVAALYLLFHQVPTLYVPDHEVITPES